jgi:hypothetical protein
MGYSVKKVLYYKSVNALIMVTFRKKIEFIASGFLMAVEPVVEFDAMFVQRILPKLQ